MKLHIGCGKVYLEGWTNIDIINNEADLQEDVTNLVSIANNSCDIIYACHVLEHLGRDEFFSGLAHWRDKLKVGGILRLAVPDLEQVFKMYNGANLHLLFGFLYGGQRDEFDYHKMGFDYHTLSTYLKNLRFEDIKLWDWRTVTHGVYDDYSQAYLPHMDKENGTLMSLNIQAEKCILL